MKNAIVSSVLLFLCYAGSANACIGNITDELLCETPEILFETGEAIVIQEKAQALGSAVNIYEYLRNNAEYAVYHGARSSSLNTFLAMEGNDVDLASTLIAMFRSVGIKSRYAVGNARLKRSDIANWIKVENESLAVSILQNQGITVADDPAPTSDADYAMVERVWVEALVNFSNYRGASNAILPCAAVSDQCKWVSLDPSFKLRTYKNNGYSNLLSSMNFDYAAYYAAESDQSLRDKSPLEIFEEDALEYLRDNYLGVSLEDVIDNGVSVEESLGLLPSSLPFSVAGTVARYNSVELHDEPIESGLWTKYVRGVVNPMVNGGVCENINYTVPEVKLADVSTKRYTLSWNITPEGDGAVFRLGGVTVGDLSVNFSGVSCRSTDPITGAVTTHGVYNSSEFGLDSSFSIELHIDTGGTPIEVEYNNLTLGGYYLIATGGEASNWSQVRRAYEQLLQANKDYPLINDTNGNVYVDENNNGSIDSTESLLLEHQEAEDALTGGLLYTAQALYYTRLKEESRRYSRLKNIISPIAAFAGIVSTVYEVEKIDDTPFAVLPGGLLIDLKGLRINGSWEMDQAEAYSNETFKFIGHVASSLEHEIWQELTGYDAVSTMRGIQFALNDGAELMDVHNRAAEDTFEASLTQMGLTHAAPANFIHREYEVFGRHQSAWEYTGTSPSTDAFYVFRGDVSAYGVGDYQAGRYLYEANNGLDDFFSNINGIEDQLLQLIDDGVTAAYLDVTTGCGGSYTDQTPAEALAIFEACFNQQLSGSSNFVNFFDQNIAFEPSAVFYKSITPGLEEYGIDFVNDVRNHMYFASSDVWFNFTAPSKLTRGPFYLFEVYIKDAMDTVNENVISSAYIIRNHSSRLVAGGGYVPEQDTLVNPADSIEGLEGSGTTLDTSGVTFNNEVFTDQNLVAIANNDVVRTPSTVDPVSTVTGNMYHDETDFVIPGKGLPYTFTRTYNSNETTTDGAGSVNPSFLPLSQGWTHSYNMKLVSNDYGQYPNYDASLAPENDNNSTSSITYVDERGGESNYLLNDASGSSQPESPRAGFDDLVLNSPSSGLHTITYSNGVKYIFDSQGANLRSPNTVARLHRIEDAYGNQLNFAYTNNRLTSVTDNINLVGRSGLTLEYFTSGANTGRLRYVNDWTGRRWEYQYSNGHLSSVINPLNNAMEYTYVDGTHWLKDIIHPQDRGGKQKTMTFSYYENGQAYSYVDQNASKESLIYDLFRRRTRITNPRGLITEHYYDENGALVKLKEPDNGILLFENNADGLRYLKYNALGQRTRYSYNTSRDLSGVASNTNGLVTREQDALGYTVDYDYGVNGQVTTVSDKNNQSFTNEYYTTTNATTGAVRGKLYRTIAAQARVNGVQRTNVTLAEYQYHSDGTPKQVIEYIDPAEPNRRRITNHTYAYNSDGSFTRTTTVSGSGTTVTTVQVFDRLWRLTSSTVNRRTSPTNATQIALTTHYEYDGLGRLVRTTDPIDNIAETVYDGNGKVYQSIVRYRLQASNNSPIHPECSVDAAYPNHHTCVMVTNTYDAGDRLVSSVDIKGAITQYQYDPMGSVLNVTNGLGNSLSYVYDAMGRRTKVTDEKGYTVKTEYDLAGRVTKITDANNHSITYTYDALGRQLTATSPQGRITRFDQYDGNGNIIRMTDANGVAGTQPRNSQNASVYNVFDEFNRITSSLNADNETTAYTYDLLGNRTSVTDAKNQKTTFVYNDLGRLTSVIDPIIESGSDKVVTITYDEVGNRLTYEDRLGEVTRYTYDNLNRLLEENYLADGIVATKTYDQYGDLVSTSYDGNTYTYTYDVTHRLLSKTDTRTNISMSWEYDVVGNLIRKTNYEGDVHTFTYDSSNRLVSMAVGEDPILLQASYHYDPAGRLLSRILSNGASTLYGYTADGFVSSVRQLGADGSTIDLREFEHDNVGNIEKLTLNGSEVTDYSYDPAYRLLSANSNINSHDFSYTYDDVGNRLTKTANGNTKHFIYGNGNRLNQVRQNSTSGALVYSFAYDDNGSMTDKYGASGQPLLHVDYDQRRLASVMAVNNMPNSLAFEYDANAYRIEKQNGEGTKKYYLEAEHLESVYDENDQLQANYLRGAVIDEIINGFERNDSGVLENRTFHHDQVNSVVALSDHNGNAAQTLSYGPFGEAISESGNSHNAMKYTGREQDAESGLYYYRARYYDPELGRFISEDPIGFGGGINYYAYVKNNPVIFGDPSGLGPFKWIKELVDAGRNRIDNFQGELAGHGRGFGAKAPDQVTPGTTRLDGQYIDDRGFIQPWSAHYDEFGRPVERTDFNAGNVAENIDDTHHHLYDYNSSSAAHGNSFGGISTDHIPGVGPTNQSGGVLVDVLGVVSGTLAIVGTGLEILDAFEPASALFSSHAGEIDDPSQYAGAVPAYGYPGNPYNDTASGGFVLYPSRINSNMIQSVYSK